MLPAAAPDSGGLQALLSDMAFRLARMEHVLRRLTPPDVWQRADTAALAAVAAVTAKYAETRVDEYVLKGQVTQ